MRHRARRYRPGCGDAQPDPEPSPTTTEASPTTSTLTAIGTPRPPGPRRSGSTADVVTGLAAPWSVAVLADGTALVSQRDDGRCSTWSRTERLDATPAGVVPGVVHNNEGVCSVWPWHRPATRGLRDVHDLERTTGSCGWSWDGSTLGRRFADLHWHCQGGQPQRWSTDLRAGWDALHRYRGRREFGVRPGDGAA